MFRILNLYFLFSFAAELVMLSMQFLPREIPPHFNNTYTPIAAAGTETQVEIIKGRKT